jgi:rSAM-associated Gly-rich repeat protein
MSLRNRYLQLLTSLLPSGAFGLSVALASSAAKATPVEPEPQRAAPPSTFSVAEELQAIRDGVDQARVEMLGGLKGQSTDPDVRLAFWLNGNGLGWGNGGSVWGNGGYPAWTNVRPWGNGWGNGGWFNAGPWRNGGGWHNGGGWGNGGGWHNWRNGGWRN